MTLLAFGINHNTAALDIRERVAFAPEQMQAALGQLCEQAGVEEAAILSTCNRTEMYVRMDHHVSGGEQVLLQWLAQYHRLNVEDLANCHYWQQDADAVAHMMSVAAGLDSLVLGEPQILGQMKSAYSVACDASSIGSFLHNTFHRVFTIAKRVRTETAIGENPVSVAYAAVTLAQQIFSNLRNDTALLVGAGETIELVAQHLSQQNIGQLIVANRTLERAQELAEKYSAEAILLADIPDQLHRADIVITSTASQLPLLGKGAVESALKKRRHKPMFMVDIAVPRDIEPEVADLSDVYLYSVDDLREVIDENRRSREEAAQKAKAIIQQGVEEFQAELRALDSVATIRAYRKKAEQLRDQELNKALRALESGVEAEKVLNQLARGLTNKLLHAPTSRLKQAGAQGDNQLIDISQQLFDLAPVDQPLDLSVHTLADQSSFQDPSTPQSPPASRPSSKPDDL